MPLQIQSNEAWAAFCREPSDDKFRLFYEATRGLVFAIGYRVLISEEDVEDLFQNVYRELFELARSTNGAAEIENVDDYVRKLAQRIASTRKQQRYRESIRTVYVADLDDLQSGSASIFELVSREDIRQKVASVLAALPENYRLPIQLYYFTGMTHGEIADALGVTRSAVTKHIAEGMRRLTPLMRNAGLGDALKVLAALLGATEVLRRGVFRPTNSVSQLADHNQISRLEASTGSIGRTAVNSYLRMKSLMGAAAIFVFLAIVSFVIHRALNLTTLVVGQHVAPAVTPISPVQPHRNQRMLPTPSTTVPTQFRSRQVGFIGGRVISAYDREPLPQVSITATSRGSQIFNTISSSDGIFSFRALPYDSYELQLEPPSPWLPFNLTVVVTAEIGSNVGNIELHQSGVIHGRVVRTDDGSGVAGERVELQNVVDRNWPTVESNRDGEFTFKDLKLRAYGLHVKERQHLYMNVSLDDSARANVQLPIGGSTLKGRIYRGGQLYPTASIRAIRRNDASGLARLGWTGDDATFEIHELPPGVWQAEVFPFSRRLGKQRALFEFETTQATVLEQEFTLPSGLLVGNVVDVDGIAVSGAIVTAFAASDYIGRPAVAVQDVAATSTEDGSFIFGALPPDTYTVIAKAAFGVSVSRQVAVPFDGASSSETLVIASVRGSTIVSIALDFTTGKPVRDAWCLLTNNGLPYSHSALRDDNGAMILSGIPPGRYQLEVSAHGYSVNSHDVTLISGGTVTLYDVLHEAGAIEWRLEGPTGRPVAGAACHLLPLDRDTIERTRTGVTGPDGVWIVRGLWPGKYFLSAIASETEVRETLTVHVQNLTRKTTAVAVQNE